LVLQTNCLYVNYSLVMGMDVMQYLKESVLMGLVFAGLVVCYMEMRIRVRMSAQG
jgi:hypothetical protein